MHDTTTATKDTSTLYVFHKFESTLNIINWKVIGLLQYHRECSCAMK